MFRMTVDQQQLAKDLAFLKNHSPLRITVSGAIGAGKSTFAKRLAHELNIPRIYMGQFMREEASRRNMTLDAFNELLAQDDEVDRALDAMQVQKGRELERAVFEGRTSWHFIERPDVKVFLDVSNHVASLRIFNDKNALRDRYHSVAEVEKANIERKANEIKRYESYYGIDVYDTNNFNVVIDTTPLTTEEVYAETVHAIAKHLQHRSTTLDEIS